MEEGKKKIEYQTKQKDLIKLIKFVKEKIITDIKKDSK